MTENKKNTTDGVAAPVMRLYSMADAAKMWGLTYWELRRLIQSGRVRPYVGIGRGFKFDGTELKAENLERL